MRISPISYASFRGGSLKINIQGMKPEELYNYNEYKAFAQRRNADITITQVPRLYSFYLPNHKNFIITVEEIYNGEKLTQNATVSLPKSTSQSHIESDIRKAIYEAFMEIEKKLNLIFEKTNLIKK